MSRGPDRDIDRIAHRADIQPRGESPGQGRDQGGFPARKRRQDRDFTRRVREQSLSSGGQELLYDVGRFRTVAVLDLVRFQNESPRNSRPNLAELVARGLARTRTVWFNKNAGKLDVVVLTKAGKRLIEKSIPDSSQAVYSGFVKPAEIPHDAAIYRMFQREKRAIESGGGRIRRIVLDYELKRNIYAPLAKVRGTLPPQEYARKQAEVAEANHLKVVGGKIPLPDLRIEYETPEGEIARVDLELATHHYHGSQLAEKVQAGFKMYAPPGGGPRTTVYEGREVTADILSL